jgi:hypothetical protein
MTARTAIRSVAGFATNAAPQCRQSAPLRLWAESEAMTVKLPVVDGDSNADIYGYAKTERGAKRVANRYFADLVHSAYRSGPIHLREGGTIPEAWVVLTTYGAGLA